MSNIYQWKQAEFEGLLWVAQENIQWHFLKQKDFMALKRRVDRARAPVKQIKVFRATLMSITSHYGKIKGEK